MGSAAGLDKHPSSEPTRHAHAIEELHPLLPSGTGINAEYVAAAAQEGVFGELQGMLKEKRQGHEVADWINAQGLSQASPDVLLRSLAVATLERGQKCITHHDVLLKRYSTPLRELVEKAGRALPANPTSQPARCVLH